jgi:hypothetical protein
VARKRKAPSVTPRIAPEASPSALAHAFANAVKDVDSDFVDPFTEEAIFRLTRLAPEAALAELVLGINAGFRRLAFEQRQTARAIADLGLQPTGPAVPFRQGMQTIIDALPELYENAQVIIEAHPSRPHLEVLMEEVGRFKDNADTEFRRQRRRGGAAGGDPGATMRAARRRETKPKPKV